MAGFCTRPKEYIPETEEELQEIIQKVKKQGGLLLLTCAGIEWSGLPEDKKCSKLDLSKLLEKNQREVTVEPKEPPAKRRRTSTGTTGASAKLDSSSAQGDIKVTRNKMQARIGPSTEIIMENFSNWSGTQTASVLAAKPKSLTELQKLISAAKSLGLKVRCAGTKHSWSSIFADQNQLLMYMDEMASDYPNNKGIYMEVGVGKDCKCPCDYVVQMRIVNSNGKLQTYCRRPQDNAMMKAVAANFGLFGVVYDITLQLEKKQPIVKTVHNYFKVQQIFYTPDVLENMVANNWSMELFWFPMNSFLFGPEEYSPKNDEVMARLINPDEEGHDPVDEEYYVKQGFFDWVSSFLLFLFQDLFKNPTLLPVMQSLSFVMLREVIYPHNQELYEKLTNAIHFRKHAEMVPVYDLEFAFDLSEQKNCEMIRKACQVVIEEVEKRRSQGKCPLNIALEMRWMSDGNSHLSPASIVANSNARDPKVIYIEVLSLTGTEGWEDFCSVIATAWMKLGGIPHLAKQWDFLSDLGIDINNHIRQRFGDRIKQFKDQLQLSNADPSRMFLNTRLEQLIYPQK